MALSFPACQLVLSKKLARVNDISGVLYLVDPMWIFNYCACALSETFLFMVQSHYMSCVFPYVTHWCILAQNTRHPRMCLSCSHKIVCYLVWISFSMALVTTLQDFQYKGGKA